MAIISFTIATNEPHLFSTFMRLLCYHFIDSIGEYTRTDVKRRRRVTEFVCTLRSSAKWFMIVDISVIRRNTGPRARLALENTKAFSLTARIVLKDDLRTRARASSSQFKREKVKVERSVVLEAFHI